MWTAPTFDALTQVIAGANNRLLLCSPYISRPALHVVSDALPKSVNHIEVWTKLSAEDWLVGASQPDGLLEFIDLVESRNVTTSVRESHSLHAKIIYSDGDEGLAGSSNLTAGGFGNNLEVVKRVNGSELAELRTFAETLRPQLNSVPLESFRNFVGQCLDKIDSQEALLQLIREEIPDGTIGTSQLIPYSDYLRLVDQSTSQLEIQIRTIARNLDNNNNSGKIKQAFYGIQRFLQEYPQHLTFIRGLPQQEWFDVSESALWNDWRAFLTNYAAESSDAYSYSIAALIRYLTPSSGGTRTGGGGGDNELKRVWASVGRMMTS